MDTLDSQTTAAPRLHRTLGFWALTAYGVGDILGAGIYALVGKVAAQAGHFAWLAFAVTLVVAALTALSYAELARRFPRSGGEAHFCQKAFGRPTLALAVGWLVFASGLVSLATVSRAFVGYLMQLFPPLGISVEWLAVVGFALVLAVINFWGIRQSSATNIVCTIVEAFGLLFVIGVGLWFISRGGQPPANAEAARPEALGVLSGAALAFFAFIGFEDMVNVAEEVKRPRRNLPAAILTALAVAALAYVAVAWVATRVVPLDVLAESKAPLLEVIRLGAPAMPDWPFTIVALFAVTNTGLLNFIMGSRLLYGMSKQKLLPAWLDAVHPRTHTPHRAIAFMLLLAIALAFSGTLAHLAGTTNALLLLVFLMVNVSLIALKLREKTRRPGFSVPLMTPVLGAATCMFLVFFLPLKSLVLAAVIVAVGGTIVAWRWTSLPAAR